MSTTGKRKYVFVVIQASDVKKFVLLDLIGGTLLFYALKFPLHSVVAASLGSMAGSMLLRRTWPKKRRPGYRTRYRST